MPKSHQQNVERPESSNYLHLRLIQPDEFDCLGILMIVYLQKI